MLASILPGLRDIRTPLATGYLYAFLIWLTFGQNLLPSSTENELLERVRELSDMVGATATLAAVSFTCYLVGSTLVIREVPRLVPRAGLRPHDGLVYPRRGPSTSLRTWCVETARAIVAKGWTADKLLEITDLPRAFRLDIASGLEEWYREQVTEIGEDEIDQANTSVISDALLRDVSGSYDTLTTRLQLERPVIWQDYDRLRSEAELRFSIFTPLTGIVLAVAVLWTPWAGGLIALPTVLLIYGMRHQREAGLKVEQALTQDVVKLPIVERLLVEGPPRVSRVVV